MPCTGASRKISPMSAIPGSGRPSISLNGQFWGEHGIGNEGCGTHALAALGTGIHVDGASALSGLNDTKTLEKNGTPFPLLYPRATKCPAERSTLSWMSTAVRAAAIPGGRPMGLGPRMTINVPTFLYLLCVSSAVASVIACAVGESAKQAKISGMRSGRINIFLKILNSVSGFIFVSFLC